MKRPEHYELVFQHEGQQSGRAEVDVVEVHRTEASGAGGHPVYVDDTGIVRAEISEDGEVRMLASGGHQAHRARVSARPVQPHG